MAIDLRITGVTSEMQGVGRLDGRAVFVPGALPGEQVSAEIVREQGRYAVARLLFVSEPSPARRESECPYFGRCGGCQARHMSYELSLELKTSRVNDALTRIGGFEAPKVLHTIGMDAPERYRNKAEYAIDGKKIGLRHADGRGVLPVEDCLLQSEGSISVMRAMRGWLAEHADPHLKYLVTRINQSGTLMAILSSEGRFDGKPAANALMQANPQLASVFGCTLRKGHAHALDGNIFPLAGDSPVLMDTLRGIQFAISPQAFFQINPTQTEKLYGLALEYAALTGRETVVDAYCGAGTIALTMAARARHVLGVEMIPSAVENARENAKRANLTDKADFRCGRAEQILPELLKRSLRPDVVVVDPPRKGLDEALIQAILLSKPDRFIYVSCDPSTLARDLKMLRQGGYALSLVQPVDMFPWTAHVECVVLMSRVKE